MGKADQTQLWNKLERLCLAWRDLEPDSDAARASLNLELTATLLELFPRRDALEALGAFWLMDLDKYDPEKGDFCGYMLARLGLREQDLQRKDAEMRRETRKENGQKRQQWVRAGSLDAPAGEGQEETAGSRLADGSAASGQENLEVESRAWELITLILLLPQRLTGQANNANRINYYRMFFTDGTVAALFSVGDRPYRAHERDLFAAMKLPFLDFFLEDTCRSVDAILSSDLKAYGRIVEGRPMEPPGQPLPNDVYLEYLNAKEEAGVKSMSAISNQRAAYYKFLKENLC